MLHRIIGRAHSGKTEYIFEALESAMNSGFECVVIVPEQQSVQTEKKLCEEFGNAYNMRCEVLNFERLPNRVYREYGGLARTALDRAGAYALLSITSEKLSKQLRVYSTSCYSNDFIKKTLLTIEKLKASGVSAQSIQNASENLAKTGEKLLSDKLHDISLLYSKYSEALSGGFSDKLDSLSSLARSLPDMNFFGGKLVFIDGYYTFTEPEYNVLFEIIKQSADTFITVLADFEDETELFAETIMTAHTIEKRVTCRIDDIYVDSPGAYSSESLSYLQKNFYKADAPKVLNDSCINIYECDSPFDEAQTAAAEVMKLVRGGMRYRDISIAMRNTESYDGVINVVFEKFGIPFYFAEKDALSSKGIASLIIACIEIAYSDYSLQSVRRYIKSSYSALTIKEADILVTYAEIWNIRSKSWYGEKEWAMNPDGYKAELTKRGEHMLSAANYAREKLISALLPLTETLNSPKLTVKAALTALYEHLVFIGANRKLEAQSASLLAEGKDEESSRLSLIWDSVINSFDSLCTVCGNEIITPKRLAGILSLMFDEYKIGSIPPSVDHVDIGSAALMRPESCRAMIILGAADGVFPQAPSDDGLFDKSEKKTLTLFGIESEKTPVRVMCEERFMFYYVCSCPKDKLTMLYVKNDDTRISSSAFFAASLFNIKICKYPDKLKLFCIKALRENVYMLTDKDKREYSLEPPQALSEQQAFIEESDERTIRLTSSRVETYRKCPFSYFAKYILKLQKNKKAQLDSIDIGNFFHKMLEVFITRRTYTGKFISITKEDIISEVNELTEEYILTVCRSHAQLTRRLRYSFDRLKKALVLLFENICAEFEICAFVPSGTEVPITASFTAENGQNICIYGVVDRIDELEHDGKKYIRVIDYKTGNKKFDKEAVENGIDLQMFIYLFAYCRTEADRLPAGVLYVPVKPPSISAESVIEDDMLEKSVEKEYKRTGLLLEDDDLLNQMESGKKGRFIPVSSASLESLERFGELENDIRRRIADIGTEMLRGNMCQKPFVYKKKCPCDYCDMKTVCRIKR